MPYDPDGYFDDIAGTDLFGDMTDLDRKRVTRKYQHKERRRQRFDPSAVGKGDPPDLSELEQVYPPEGCLTVVCLDCLTVWPANRVRWFDRGSASLVPAWYDPNCKKLVCPNDWAYGVTYGRT